MRSSVTGTEIFKIIRDQIYNEISLQTFFCIGNEDILIIKLNDNIF